MAAAAMHDAVRVVALFAGMVHEVGRAVRSCQQPHGGTAALQAALQTALQAAALAAAAAAVWWCWCREPPVAAPPSLDPDAGPAQEADDDDDAHYFSPWARRVSGRLDRW